MNRIFVCSVAEIISTNTPFYLARVTYYDSIRFHYIYIIDIEENL